MGNPTLSFLDKFSSDRNLSIPLPFQWTVNIDTSSLTGAIQSALRKINQNWKVSPGQTWEDNQNNNIYVAQEVQLPSENYEVTSIGPDSNRGGFLPGYGVTQRSDFLQRNVSINFLETTKDIEAELIRPWIIAISIDGLLNQSLKSPSIEVIQYDRQMNPRKKYKFTNAFPTNVEGYTINYTNDDLIVKSVSFAYENYIIETIAPAGGYTGDINIPSATIA